MNSINSNKLHKLHKLKEGFTLVEVIFVVFFSAIILGLVWSILSTGEDAWYTADTKTEMQDNLRIGMNRMVKELHGATSIDGTIFDANDISDNFLRFTGNGNTVEYSIANNQLRRTESGNATVLANNIDSVRFTISGGDMLEIDLSGKRVTPLRRELNFNLTSRVVLRN